MSSEAVQEAVESPALAREPWRAANLSLMVPGLGQLEMGARAAGWFFIVTSVLLWLLGAAFFVTPGLPGTVGVVLLVLALLFDIVAVVDAHARAKSANTPEQEETRTSQRDAWKTIFL